MIETDFLETIQSYLVYIVFIIPKLIKSPVIQLIILGLLFLSGILHKYYFSKSAQNNMFFNDFRKELESNSTIIFANIMNPEISNQIHYSGEEGRINIGQFFEHLLKTEANIVKKYGNKVKIWQTVINEEPSFIFQINKTEDNYKKVYQHIYNKNRAFLSPAKQKQGFESLLNRRLYFDENSQIKHLSIYWKDGEAQSGFDKNVANSDGKIKGFKIDDPNIIKASLRGQFTIIKYHAGAILLFIEYNGQQFYNENGYNQDKQLIFYYCNNKQNIQTFNKDLYNILYLTGILNDL